MTDEIIEGYENPEDVPEETRFELDTIPNGASAATIQQFLGTERTDVLEVLSRTDEDGTESIEIVPIGDTFTPTDEQEIMNLLNTQYNPAILTLLTRQDLDGDPNEGTEDTTIFEVQVNLPLNQDNATEIDVAVDGTPYAVTLTNGVGTIEIETPEPDGSVIFVTVPSYPHKALRLEV